MIARIFTYLFYAGLFFGLGVWAAPTVGRYGGVFDDGIALMTTTTSQLWAWAEGTIATPPAWNARPSAATPASAPVAATAPAAPSPAPAPAKVATPSAAPVATPVTKTAAVTPPAPPAAAPPPAPAKVEPAVAAAPAGDPVERARSAWSRGDAVGAIRAYEEAIAAHPDDVMLNGELGNVYWTSGRLADAARVYHRAGKELIAAGRSDAAARLIEPIRRGDAALADDLAARLAAKP